jgi:hypothetical protein
VLLCGQGEEERGDVFHRELERRRRRRLLLKSRVLEQCLVIRRA